ncbi:hypothetical protein P9112_014292 [Eukaryota sp. TZLM1-RC]
MHTTPQLSIDPADDCFSVTTNQILYQLYFTSPRCSDIVHLLHSLTDKIAQYREEIVLASQSQVFATFSQTLTCPDSTFPLHTPIDTPQVSPLRSTHFSLDSTHSYDFPSDSFLSCISDFSIPSTSPPPSSFSVSNPTALILTDLLRFLYSLLTFSDPSVRTAALRCCRYLFCTPHLTRKAFTLGYHFFISKSLESTSTESVEALRLTRHLIDKFPFSLPHFLLRSLLSVAESSCSLHSAAIEGLVIYTGQCPKVCIALDIDSFLYSIIMRSCFDCFLASVLGAFCYSSEYEKNGLLVVRKDLICGCVGMLEKCPSCQYEQVFKILRFLSSSWAGLFTLHNSRPCVFGLLMQILGSLYTREALIVEILKFFTDLVKGLNKDQFYLSQIFQSFLAFYLIDLNIVQTLYQLLNRAGISFEIQHLSSHLLYLLSLLEPCFLFDLEVDSYALICPQNIPFQSEFLRNLHDEKFDVEPLMSSSQNLELVNDLISKTNVLVTKNSSLWKWTSIMSTVRKLHDLHVEHFTNDSNTNNIYKFFSRLVEFYTPSCGVFCKLRPTKVSRKLYFEPGKILFQFLVQNFEIFGAFIDPFISNLLAQIGDESSEFSSLSQSCSMLSEVIELLSIVISSLEGFAFVVDQSFIEILKRRVKSIDELNSKIHEKLLCLLVQSIDFEYLTNSKFSDLLISFVRVTCLECSSIQLQTVLVRHLHKFLPKFLLNKVVSSCKFLFALTEILISLLVSLPISSNFHSFEVGICVSVIVDFFVMFDTCHQILNHIANLLYSLAFDFLFSCFENHPTLVSLFEPLFILISSFESGFLLLKSLNCLDSFLEEWVVENCNNYAQDLEFGLIFSFNRCLVEDNTGVVTSSMTSSLGQNEKNLIEFKPHLYGQLVNHPLGVEYLKSKRIVAEILEDFTTTDTCKRLLRGNIWALAHIGSTELGFELLVSSIDQIFKILLDIDTKHSSLIGTLLLASFLFCKHGKGRIFLTTHNFKIINEKFALPNNYAEFFAVSGTTNISEPFSLIRKQNFEGEESKFLEVLTNFLFKSKRSDVELNAYLKQKLNFSCDSYKRDHNILIQIFDFLNFHHLSNSKRRELWNFIDFSQLDEAFYIKLSSDYSS